MLRFLRDQVRWSLAFYLIYLRKDITAESSWKRGSSGRELKCSKIESIMQDILSPDQSALTPQSCAAKHTVPSSTPRCCVQSSHSLSPSPSESLPSSSISSS